MDTVVVHVKNVSLDDASVAYIGRGGRGREGTFGNPHPVGRCSICNTSHDREGSIAAYKQYFWQRVNEDDAFFLAVMQLEGKQLACFCKPKACHGDVIVKFLDWVGTETSTGWLRDRFKEIEEAPSTQP